MRLLGNVVPVQTPRNQLKPPTLNWWPLEFWSINRSMRTFEAFIVMLLFTCCWMCLASAREPMTFKRPLLSWHVACVIWRILGSKIVAVDSRAQFCWGFFDFVVVRGCLANQTSGEVFFITNSKKGPLKMDGWKMTISFWGPCAGYLQLVFVVLLTSGSCNPLKGDFKTFLGWWIGTHHSKPCVNSTWEGPRKISPKVLAVGKGQWLEHDNSGLLEICWNFAKDYVLSG